MKTLVTILNVTLLSMLSIAPHTSQAAGTGFRSCGGSLIVFVGSELCYNGLCPNLPAPLSAGAEGTGNEDGPTRCGRLAAPAECGGQTRDCVAAAVPASE